MIEYIIVAIIVLYVLNKTMTTLTAGDPLEKETDETIVAGKFTPQLLQKYNGSDNPKIFIAVRGNVYDASQGAVFYGPGGPYENFAGRDASRGLARNSFELENLTPIGEPIDTLSDLTPEEIESLNGWEEHFENKYLVVGTLHNELP